MPVDLTVRTESTRDRRNRLVDAKVIRAGLEDLWQRVEGTHPQFQARFLERRVDEARMEQAIRREFLALRPALGDLRVWVSIARRMWEAGAVDERGRRVVARVLGRQLSKRWTRSMRKAAILRIQAEILDTALRARFSIQSVFERSLLKKQSWSDMESVYADLYEDLVEQSAERLESAFQGYAGDYAHRIIGATDPRNPIPLPKLVRDLESSFIGISRKRALMIARTETAYAYGAVAYVQGSKAGFKRYRWLTVAGSPVAVTNDACDFCTSLAAQGWSDVQDGFEAELTVGIRDPKSISISALHPPYHPNCRCDITFDTEGWLPPRDLATPVAGPGGGLPSGVPANMPNFSTAVITPKDKRTVAGLQKWVAEEFGKSGMKGRFTGKVVTYRDQAAWSRSFGSGYDNVAGFTRFDGSIHISPQVEKRLLAILKNPELVNTVMVNDLKMLVHEALHATSPVKLKGLQGLYGSKWGRALEEGLAEAYAMEVTGKFAQALFGDIANAVKMRGRLKSVYPAYTNVMYGLARKTSMSLRTTLHRWRITNLDVLPRRIARDIAEANGFRHSTVHVNQIERAIRSLGPDNGDGVITTIQTVIRNATKVKKEMS